MSLESRVCFIQNQPLSPSYNMNINEAYFNLVQSGKHSAVARVYKHTPGIILAQHQSLNDIDVNFCREKNLDITVRPTGGAAVYVSPQNTLCYTIILDADAMNLNRDTTKLYRGFTDLLTNELEKRGLPVGLSNHGWYVVKKTADSVVPLIGHSQRVRKNIYQIDGIAHLSKLPMDLVGRAIKMRRFYEHDGEKYILVDGRYIGKGDYSIDDNKSRLIRDEHSELSKMVGFTDMGLSEREFQDIVIDSIQQFISCNSLHPENLSYLGKIEDVSHPVGSNEGLGHCFVVMKLD